MDRRPSPDGSINRRDRALSLSQAGRSIAEPAAFIDTKVLVRHLTNDPPELAERATRYQREG